MLVTRRLSDQVVEFTTKPSSRKTRQPYALRGQEPRVEDVLADPMVKALMARDRVHEGELRSLLAVARAALSERRGASA